MEHSKNFDKVKTYYENYINGKKPFWSKTNVRNAVGRWITAEEYKEITGEDYDSEESAGGIEMKPVSE